MKIIKKHLVCFRFICPNIYFSFLHFYHLNVSFKIKNLFSSINGIIYDTLGLPWCVWHISPSFFVNIFPLWLAACYTLSAKNFGEKKFRWKYFRWKKFRWLFVRFRCNFRWKSSKFRWTKFWYKIFCGKNFGDFLPNICLKFGEIKENFYVNWTKKSTTLILGSLENILANTFYIILFTLF